MPDHPSFIVRAKPPGRLRRAVTRTTLVLMQVTFGAAFLVGTFWGVTGFLAGDFEPLFDGAAEPITARASAPQALGPTVLATTTQAQLVAMPEIKNGVPELMPVRASVSRPSDLPKLSPAVARNAPLPPISAEPIQTKVANVSSEAVGNTEPAASHLPRLEEQRVTLAHPAMTSASAMPDATPEVPRVTSGATELSGNGAPSLPQATPATHSPQPTHEAARAEGDANKTQMVTAASPLSQTEDQERGAAKKAKRVVQTPQTHDAKRTGRSAAQPSSSPKAGASSSNGPLKRNDKPATAQRTRVAAARPETTAAASPTVVAAAPGASEQRLHLLGIPLPTGQKVRECLLEWRC
jgi:hypothetical protein